MQNMLGKVAFITGASSGIGAAMAREYARIGADVVVTARRKERLDEVAAAVRELGAEALPLACDVTVDGELEAAVGEAIERFGRLDHVQANAGFGVAGPFHKLTVDDYRRQFETNVFGVLRTVAATREPLIQFKGSLALMGSIAGFIALPDGSPYCMSKFAITALASSLYFELRPHGVAVTLVAPGFVTSEIRHRDNQGALIEGSEDPVPPWLSMDTDVAARQIVRATVKRRRQVIVTKHGKVLVFLQRYTPWLLRAFAKRTGVSGRKPAKARTSS
jgi:short-subunit dehydrogenase